MGTKIQQLDVGQFKLELWEVGGNERIRPYWNRYADGISGLVYVIDYSDKARLSESIDALIHVFETIGYSRLTTLVLLNKAEADAAIEDVSSQIAPRLPEGNPFSVVRANGSDEEGTAEVVLSWMPNALLQEVERARARAQQQE